MNIKHPFEPVVNSESKIIILGSFPSAKSRENNFYYGHPQNRFWQLISKIVDCPLPITVEDKKEMLLKNHIAVWDVLNSCEIEGSADSSIKNPVPNDIYGVIMGSNIKRIYFNGNKAREIYVKYIKEKPNIEIYTLPSSSPANAQYPFDRLYENWKQSILL